MIEWLSKKYPNKQLIFSDDELVYVDGKYWLAKRIYNNHKILIYENRRRKYEGKEIWIVGYNDNNYGSEPDIVFKFEYGMKNYENIEIHYTRSYETRHIKLNYSTYWKLGEIAKRTGQTIEEVIDTLATQKIKEITNLYH